MALTETQVGKPFLVGQSARPDAQDPQAPELTGLMTLLRHGGVCSERDIAKAILEYDQSQIEYYTKITNNMVGRVLRHHQIVAKHQNDQPSG